MGRGTLVCWRLRLVIGVDVCWRREVPTGARLFASSVYLVRHAIVCASLSGPIPNVRAVWLSIAPSSAEAVGIGMYGSCPASAVLYTHCLSNMSKMSRMQHLSIAQLARKRNSERLTVDVPVIRMSLVRFRFERVHSFITLSRATLV